MTYCIYSSIVVIMNTAREINNRLDEILMLRAEIRKMDAEITNDVVLNNITTGEKTNKAGALRVVETMIDQIKSDINKITNNGLNVKNIFTNNYYVNDFLQDKEIAEKNLEDMKNFVKKKEKLLTPNKK